MKSAFLFLLVFFAGCTVNIDSQGNNILNNSDNNVIEQNSNNISNNIVSQNNSLVLTIWYDEGVSIQLPQNWAVAFYGVCASKSFVAYDINNPIRQVFFFSEAGPVYTSQAQKDNDLAYVAMGGYALPYVNAPVVSPLNAQNFLEHFIELAEMEAIKEAVPLAPKINELQIISSNKSLVSLFPNSNDAETIRALFKQENILGEGLFYIETLDYGLLTLGFNNLGYASIFIGLSAKEDEFTEYEELLNNILNSYTISEEYVSACIQAQNQAASAALKAGQTLSETSDIIMDSWDNRQRSDDIISEKWSDTTLGYERVYDSETGEVYRVENGFYDSYNINREYYEMNNLEQLPENNWDLWTASTNYEEDIR
ncbi:MAG: hypothetical protein PHN56_01800 [Candidatus Nanoarchaeia archaeon]|nr:hypothetical protein [Candidatus Nanoarchaeia archaeon]